MLILFIAGIFVICLLAFLCLFLGKPKVHYCDEGVPEPTVDENGKLVYMDDFEKMAYYEED